MGVVSELLVGSAITTHHENKIWSSACKVIIRDGAYTCILGNIYRAVWKSFACLNYRDKDLEIEEHSNQI